MDNNDGGGDDGSFNSYFSSCYFNNWDSISHRSIMVNLTFNRTFSRCYTDNLNVNFIISGLRKREKCTYITCYYTYLNFTKVNCKLYFNRVDRPLERCNGDRGNG